jgi:monoamine oxidase
VGQLLAQTAFAPYGAGQVTERLANELGDRVVLERPVHRIEEGGRRATVIAGDWDYRASAGIIAVPPHLAGAID